MLDAAGIRGEVSHRHGQWQLVVRNEDSVKAAAELHAYRLENPVTIDTPAKTIPVYAGAWFGIGVYTLVLVIVFVHADRGTFDRDWFAAGRTEADAILSGEWWRTLTAVTLHADFGHLLSNLIFGGVFGLLAGRILGGGVAWCCIVIAGALGNAVNAAAQVPTHSSIGASTSVFAALGMLVAHALRPRPAGSSKWLVRWSPLIGGVLLLAFTGIGGENTDVGAHAAGFLAGLGIGWLACRMPPGWLESRVLQIAGGIIGLGAIIFAWAIAFGRS